MRVKKRKRMKGEDKEEVYIHCVLKEHFPERGMGLCKPDSSVELFGCLVLLGTDVIKHQKFPPCLAKWKKN